MDLEPQDPIAWLAACADDPSSPAKVTPADLAMLTGQDTRALRAIGYCWELYCNSDESGRAAARRSVMCLLHGMQPKCRFLARELIAYAMDWPDRETLWGMVEVRS